MIELCWKDRKRHFGLPLSFTKYSLSQDRLFYERGLLSTTLDEIQLYRVRDVRVIRTLGQKIFGVGTVCLISSDKSCPEMKLENIKDPIQTKEIIVNLVNKARLANQVRSSELLDELGGDDDTDGDGLADALKDSRDLL
ncbi:MAG: PH domain-containing protein [Bacteroidales bacterium]|nr:PH domain-containing protein [Fournierella massiliensis]MCF2556118.1 PH domain-containing protein [Fournierella massiliensis]MCI6739351.1 PH domain-containing protein [Bacteroidales bacterium]